MTDEIDLTSLPTAIWLPARSLPRCYQGTPFQMVSEMADEINPGLGVPEAIELLLLELESNKRVFIRLPDDEVSDEMRAAFFVAALLITGVAKPMPSA